MREFRGDPRKRAGATGEFGSRSSNKIDADGQVKGSPLNYC